MATLFEGSLKSVLITGFEPFLGDTRNPSKEIVTAIVDEKISGFNLHSLILPVSFSRAWRQLEEKIIATPLDFILMLGLAKERSQICLERVALNWIEARSADEDGNQPPTKSIQEGSVAAWINSLPLDQWAFRLKEQGHRVELSWSAGAFVCNHVYFQTAMKLRQMPKGWKTDCLFVHVPWYDEMPIETQITAVLDLVRLL